MNVNLNALRDKLHVSDEFKQNFSEKLNTAKNTAILATKLAISVLFPMTVLTGALFTSKVEPPIGLPFLAFVAIPMVTRFQSNASTCHMAEVTDHNLKDITKFLTLSLFSGMFNLATAWNHVERTIREW